MANIGTSLFGGMFSGYGALTANEKNRSQKKDLENKAKDIKLLADPYAASLSQGYAPGGWLRASLENEGRMKTADAYNKGLGALRSGSWRYGGTGGGLAGARWKEAQIARDEGYADSMMNADLMSEDILSRMEAAKLGYRNAMQPVTVYENRMAWLGPAIAEFDKGYNAGGTY